MNEVVTVPAEKLAALGEAMEALLEAVTGTEKGPAISGLEAGHQRFVARLRARAGGEE